MKSHHRDGSSRMLSCTLMFACVCGCQVTVLVGGEKVYICIEWNVRGKKDEWRGTLCTTPR